MENNDFELLISRLIDHAECHEHVAWQDDEQRLWAEDIRSIVRIAQALRAKIADD